MIFLFFLWLCFCFSRHKKKIIKKKHLKKKLI
jgi:hypothetical protein